MVFEIDNTTKQILEEMEDHIRDMVGPISKDQGNVREEIEEIQNSLDSIDPTEQLNDIEKKIKDLSRKTEDIELKMDTVEKLLQRLIDVKCQTDKKYASAWTKLEGDE